MKKIIIVILLLITAIVITPFFIGSNVESQFRAQIAKINSNPTYELTITDYKKGWFRSGAELEMSLKMPQMESFPKFKATQDMQHGPILWQVDGLGLGLMDSEIEFEIPQDLQDELKKVDGLEEKVLFITSRTAFDLATTTHIHLNEFTVKTDENEINTKPAQGQFSYNMQGHIEGQLNWKGLSITQSGTKALSLGEITIETKQQLVNGEMFSPTAIFDGFFTFALSNLNFSGDTPAEAIEMQELQLKVTSDIKTELANIGIVANVKTLHAISQTFEDLTYDISLENLDVVSLQKINQLVSDSQGGDPMAMAANVQSLLPQLIEKGPLLKINKIGVQTHAGEIDSNLTLGINQDIYDANNPMTMMLAVDADAKGFAPEAFFTGLGLGANIEQMVQQNFLVRDQEKLSFVFSFKSGQALLNGAPMPLGGM